MPKGKINSLKEIEGRLSTTVTEIGRVTNGAGVRVLKVDGSEVELTKNWLRAF